MAALKALVGIMGLLILIGFGVLIYGLLNRLGDPAGSPVEDRIALPAGARLQSVHVSGDLILLHLADATGHNRLLTLDARRGRLLSSLSLEPAAP